MSLLFFAITISPCLSIRNKVLQADYETLFSKERIVTDVINEDEDTIIRILDLPEGKENYYEFIYEIFYRHGRRDWENDDYIWLQNAGEEYEKYRLTPYAEMNIAAEEMYHLGKDGRLYQDPDCSGTYDIVFDEITDQGDIDYFRKQIERSIEKG